MRKLALLTVFVVLKVHALTLEPFVGFGVGSFKAEKDNSSTSTTDTYDSLDTMLEGGARLSLFEFGPVEIGGVASATYGSRKTIVNKGDKTLWGTGGEDSSFYQFAYGPMLVLTSGTVRLILEYYPNVTQGTFWSESDTSNLLNEDDEIELKGYGVGVGATLGRFSLTALFRQYEVEKLKLDDVEYERDNSGNGYDHLTHGQFMFQVGFRI